MDRILTLHNITFILHSLIICFLMFVLVFASSQPYRKVNIQGVKVEVKKARSPNEQNKNRGNNMGG